jgi:hypothetical protein
MILADILFFSAFSIILYFSGDTSSLVDVSSNAMSDSNSTIPTTITDESLNDSLGTYEPSGVEQNIIDGVHKLSSYVGFSNDNKILDPVIPADLVIPVDPVEEESVRELLSLSDDEYKQFSKKERSNYIDALDAVNPEILKSNIELNNLYNEKYDMAYKYH